VSKEKKMSFWKTLGNVAKTAGNIMNPIGGIADVGLGFMNYSLQKQNLAYQKDMQQQAWAREDTATQRRVEDLKAAGLSPTLAAGSAAQVTPPIKTNAPQYDGPSLQQKALDYLTESQMRANIAQTQAQSALLDTQRKVLEHDFSTYSQVPGQTSKDHGTIPLLTRTFFDLTDWLFPKKDTSKPAHSATFQEYKKNRSISPDVLAWKEKLLSLGTYKQTHEPKGGGGGGAW
jgi:hypothetical protein